MTIYSDDPLERDPTIRPWVEDEYTRWRAGLSSKRGYPVDFDDAWAKLDTKAKLAFYLAAQRKKQVDEAQVAAAEAGVGMGAGGPRRKAKKTKREKQADGSYTDVVVEIEEEYDQGTGQWREVGPRGATPFETKFKIAQAKAAMAEAEAALKNIEFMETLRPQSEEIAREQAKTAQYVAGQQLKSLKREQARKTFEEPVKKMLIEPVQEAVVGGFKALKSTGYGKGSMEMARESFVPQPGKGSYRESPLRPAPRARFTTPMVSEVPTRMPVRTTRTGKMIPAGEAIIAPAKLAKAAIVQPTVAGSLLRTSVGESPAAQALIPQRPTRLGLSNLRVNVDTSGIRRAGALPKLKIKKNLYNDQLRKMRNLLR